MLLYATNCNLLLLSDAVMRFCFDCFYIGSIAICSFIALVRSYLLIIFDGQLSNLAACGGTTKGCADDALGGDMTPR